MEETKTVKVDVAGNANPEYYPGGLKRPYDEMPMHLPWWGPIAVLILAFLILKWMIYIKDEKRHGK